MASPILTISGGNSTFTEDGSGMLVDEALTVTDSDGGNIDGALVTINAGFVSAEDSLSFTASSGVTGAFNSTTGVLTLSGSATAEQYQTVLRTVTYQNTNTETPDSADRSIDFSLGTALASTDNGHFYEFISAPGITWANAQAAAAGKSLFGLQGYLTTVTSANENAFVAAKLAGEGWMGASDAASEGDWKWVTGPEAGTSFWSGTGGGSVVGGEYNNWGTGEPNDSGANEDHGHFLASGQWNDYAFDNASIQGYVVEYGGSGGDPSLQITGSKTVAITVVNDNPTLTSFAAPIDTVNEDTEVELTFAELAAQGNEADVDGTVGAFVVNAVSTGTLKIGTSAGTATAWSAGSNEIVDATHNAYWTADQDANGTLTAFTVVAKDNNGALSSGNVSIDIDVTPVAEVPAPAPAPAPSKTVDGVTVTNTTETTTTSITNPDTGEPQTVSTEIVTTTVPIVSDTRTDENTSTPQADIPLVSDSSGETILQVSLPSGVGLTSEAITGGDTQTLRELLITAAEPRTDQNGFSDILSHGIDSFVSGVLDEQQVTVRTVTFQTSPESPDQPAAPDSPPIIITGANGTGEQNLEHPDRQEALIIDVRNLPQGATLQLNNVEFAIIIGVTRVTGGSGQNLVVGDDAAQFIVLGAEDDVLRGGGGDDTIGSKGGDDQLYGDEGNDLVVGGIGNDTLYGGNGDDILQGGASDAGTWNFFLDTQGQMQPHFVPNDIDLADSTGRTFTGAWTQSSDNRIALIEQDYGTLEDVAVLFQAIVKYLPDTQEINHFSSLGLDKYLCKINLTFYENSIL